MSHLFKLVVNDTFEFNFKPEEIQSLDTSLLPNNQQHILSNNKSTSVKIEEANVLQRAYTVLVNGNKYQVKIKDQLDQLIEDMGLGLGLDSVEDDVFAPMPGVILSVNVAIADEVKAGDTLCVLEAMKMENALTAPRDGVIKSIDVSTNDIVEKNVLLLSLEPLQ